MFQSKTAIGDASRCSKALLPYLYKTIKLSLNMGWLSYLADRRL